MARKKKPEEHEEHANHERWMLSYADILTLLLALFIVMFAISKVDAEKMETFAKGTAEAFGNVAVTGETGNFEGGDGVLTDQKPAQNEDVPSTKPEDRNAALAQAAITKEKHRAAAAAAEKANLEKVKRELTADLKAKGLAGAVKMQLDARGLVVNIVTDKVLFDVGQAQLKPAGMKVLDGVAPAITKLPNAMIIEGHTDAQPISSARYPSNWELSTDRASVVLRYLVTKGVPASRVSSAGYADQRPIDSNRTPDGRAHNRRVAVVVLPSVPLSDAATPATSDEAESAAKAERQASDAATHDATGAQKVTPNLAPSMQPVAPVRP